MGTLAFADGVGYSLNNTLDGRRVMSPRLLHTIVSCMHPPLCEVLMISGRLTHRYRDRCARVYMLSGFDITTNFCMTLTNTLRHCTGIEHDYINLRLRLFSFAPQHVASHNG